MLDKGRFTAFDAPGAVMQTGAAAINDFGQIVGAYQNPAVPPNPQGTGMQPPSAMSAALARR